MKVIIADDEAKVANLIKALIDWDGLGMEFVGIAKNGDEALELIREHDPDIVVTDIRMPGLSGIELIGQAREIKRTVEFIIISGHRHFNYAHSAMQYGVSDYLLKPIDKDELHRTLFKMKDKITLNTALLNEREQMMRIEEDERRRKRLELFNLLMDPANRGEITREYLNDSFGYDFQDGCFRYVIFKVDGNASEIYSGALAALAEKLRELTLKHLGPVCFDLESTFIYSGGNIIINYPYDQKEKVRSALKDIFDEMRTQNNYLPTSLFTMLSGPSFDRAVGLMDSWHSAEWMMYERVITGAGSFYEGMPEMPGKFDAEGMATLIHGVTKDIEKAIDVMDEELIGKAITDAVKSLSSMNNLTGKDVRNFVKSVYDVWLAFALQYNVTYPSGEKIRENFLKRMDILPSLDGIYAFLREEIKTEFRNLKDALGEASGRPITHAKQYIKEHFAEPIVIEDIADIAGFNPSYFSTLFKKVTGGAFSEYLRGVRMDEAKRLLKETNRSVAVICGDVGYNDIKHFSASFKKATGVKPSEYRKLYSWER
jgi:two-component system response regulator YesN